ncbi:MAG: HAMP domain-containing protein [Leptospira sp.]|nr:HAMP domain-containing protein [Leptospira sp.]
MRSFFSTLLLSNWAFLLFLMITAVGVLYLDSIINPDLRILLFSFYFMVAMFGSFYISYSIAQIVILPLKQVEKKTDEINAGDFGTELLTPEIRELAKMTESINGMAKRLKTQFIDLTLEKEKFNTLLQNLKEGVFAVDLNRKILFQNQSLHPSLIRPNSQSLSLDDAHIYPEVKFMVLEAIQERIEKKSTITIGNHFLNVHIYPLRSDDYVYIYLGVVLDITEDKQNQIIREQFFQNASHELKTPITSIKGFAETLESKLGVKEGSQEKKFLDAILRNTDRMIRIIEDMMTISKLENPSSLAVMEEFNLLDSTENICASLISILNKKNQTLEIDIPKDVLIKADIVLMEHLTINLVSNASNYSPDGKKIKIVYRQNKILEFIDEGMGIPAQDVDRIFERFYRVDSNRSRKEGGTGLGLSIVKHICKLHDWDIQVLPNPTGGTIFRISME